MAKANMRTDTPIKVRYGTFSGTTDWMPCADVTVHDGVLMIRHVDDGLDMIPLHVVRGPIEVRDNSEMQSAEETS